jgi:hypothetical protein
MQGHVKKAVISGSLTTLAVACALVFAFLRSYIWVAGALALSLLSLSDFRASLKPWEDERQVLRILRDSTGQMTLDAFEEVLEKHTDGMGPYSGEHLEDLRTAFRRLVEKRRLTSENGVIHVA